MGNKFARVEFSRVLVSTDRQWSLKNGTFDLYGFSQLKQNQMTTTISQINGLGKAKNCIAQ